MSDAHSKLRPNWREARPPFQQIARLLTGRADQGMEEANIHPDRLTGVFPGKRREARRLAGKSASSLLKLRNFSSLG